MVNSEIIDIVDKNNNVIGESSVDIAHRDKMMHRVAGVFVFDVHGNLYLQKNFETGKFDLSVGGHVQKGESYESAAKREMFEEIELDVPISHVSTFLPKDAKLNHYWAIYTATAPEGWNFKETEEVKLLEKMNMSMVVEMVKSSPWAFTHGFINTINELIRIKKYG